MATDDHFKAIVPDAIAVISKPADFFRNMPKQGGYVPPLIFMVAMALLTAVIMVIVGLLGLGTGGMQAMGIMGIIIFPVMAAIFGFVGAAIVFVIWKIMGSEENYETAYRCTAYAYAYAPISALFSIIPYLGTVVGALWPMALLALASIHVHGRKENQSWAVFGVLALILVLVGLGGEKAGRHMQHNADAWHQQMQENGEMTPEEAGKAVGDFLKGLQESQK